MPYERSNSVSWWFIWQPLAKELGIKVVPTFKILKDNKVVKEVTGAKFDDLVHAIDAVRSSWKLSSLSLSLSSL